MRVAGVAKTKTEFEAKLAIRKGYPLYTARGDGTPGHGSGGLEEGPHQRDRARARDAVASRPGRPKRLAETEHPHDCGEGPHDDHAPARGGRRSEESGDRGSRARRLETVPTGRVRFGWGRCEVDRPD